ncbi:MAG: hypothetical protein AAF573_06940 [Bacteroidota bacterium]
MRLAKFILNLIEYGDVTVAHKIAPFSTEDEEEAQRTLRFYYEKDTLEMPLQAPNFHEEAATWAARYVYRAIQFLVMRDINEAEIQKYLTPFPNSKTPAIIYSADLTFRYLGDLLNLAKGLAPDDFLVKKIKQTAAEFPLSSVGIPLQGEPNLEIVLNHPSLRIAYGDRVIRQKDKKRIENEETKIIVKELLGNHAPTFWDALK